MSNAKRDGVNIETLKKTVLPMMRCENRDARKPVMLRGAHGIGKSDVIYQIAKELGYKDDQIIERRASQMMEGDTIGMPDTSEETPCTSWKPPEWLYKASQEPCVIFLDEIDRALQSVRQGLFELVGSRRMYGTELHEDTIIFSAINGGEGVTRYQVGELDLAEQDRWFVLDFDPTVEEWLDWAGRNNLNRFVFEFIADNPNMLEISEEDMEPGKHGPSRRSWHDLAQVLDEAVPDGQKPDQDFLYGQTLGHLGHECTVKFLEFVKDYEDQVSIDDILNDDDGGLIDEVVKKPGNVNNSIISQLGSKYNGDEFDDNQVRNLGRYMTELGEKPDQENAVVLFKRVEDRDCRGRLFDVTDVPVIQNSSEYDDLSDWFLDIFDADKVAMEEAAE